MSHNTLDLTKYYPTLVEILTHEDGVLSGDDKRILTSHVAEMMRLAKEAAAAQHTATAIYLHTLWKAEATLAVASALKILGGPHLSPEFEVWDQERRTRFLETLQKLADMANQKVIDLASFSRFYYKFGDALHWPDDSYTDKPTPQRRWWSGLFESDWPEEQGEMNYSLLCAWALAMSRIGS